MLNETQALIVLRLGESLDESAPMAPIDLACSIVCPLSTLVSQMATLLDQGVVERVHSVHVREVSTKGRQLYRLTKKGQGLAERLRYRLDEISELLRTSVHRGSESGSKDLSELLLEWSAQGVLQNESDLKKALMSNAIRIPRRRR